MHLLPFALLLLLTAAPAFAAEAVSGEELQLQDGRTVRLLGIKAGDAAKPALQALVQGHGLLLEDATPDRYGRQAADVYVQNPDGMRIWLQGELLKQGVAFVYPPTGSEPKLDDLLQAEQIARQAKRGIWADAAYADLPADHPDDIALGRFAFISGKIVKAERLKNMVYLNFGPDWRHDFTAAIAAHDLHFFKKAKIDPLAYEGKTIRVRGWVKRNFGPMITITHPSQIEILGH